MKLNKQFVTREIGGTQVMVAVGSAAFSGVVRSNKTAAFVVDQLKNDTTKEKIVAAMLEKYEVSAEQAGADVDRILEKLRSIGALDE
ncbi:MAG: PqqD family protein [Firmicutes bacterium]|nr:PqqD family protein [Bacillota bacterium]